MPRHYNTPRRGTHQPGGGPQHDPWPIEGEPAPPRVDPFEETARIERELPHIQREVEMRDALFELPGKAWEKGSEAVGSFISRLLSILK